MKRVFKVVLLAFFSLAMTGCVTVTGTPREDNVVYQDTAPVGADHRLSNTVSVGEVAGFTGTSVISMTGNTNPNLSNKEFKDYLEHSLVNANLYGSGYILEANLLENNDWSAWGVSLGNKNRNIIVEYTLKNSNDEVVFNEVILGDGEVTNRNFFRPYHLVEREAAEKGYRNNIANLIEALKAL
ncbi:hypothetical protein [Billgrantia aerodenitrificans]|uniref:Lipoprotein n=1 Tax=Billgrantia aerodenitrificans TaxID=2733483 RepID=A0ABS9AWU4_9GAMM|nr:hypothetical protein [Halomonas aerodenitrificans]MCE8026077.1 hypothetical protein [Halomonas aerodenitrificans]